MDESAMRLIHVYTRQQAIEDGVLVRFADYVRGEGGLSGLPTVKQEIEKIRVDQDVRFPLGELVITPAAAEAIHLVDALHCLLRHQFADWGDVDEEDWLANANALKKRERLFSVYRVEHKKDGSRQVRCNVITEATREATTILLRGDY